MLLDFRTYRTELTGKKHGATSRTDWALPDGVTQEMIRLMGEKYLGNEKEPPPPDPTRKTK